MISRDIMLAKKAQPMDRREPKPIDWKRRFQEQISDTEDVNPSYDYRKSKRVQHTLDEATMTELPEDVE